MIRKIVSTVLMAGLLFGVFGAVMVQPGKVHAAPAPAAVGVVDFGLLFGQHPDTKKAEETLKAERAEAKTEFDSKAANLSDKEKQDLGIQLGQRLEAREQELVAAILEKINAAVKAVADQKKLAIVVNKTSVIYGGQDITNDVGKKLIGK